MIPAQMYYCQAHGLVIQPHSTEGEELNRCVVGQLGGLPCDLILLKVCAAERVTEPEGVTE